jgi:hypothetical protein
MVAMIGLVAYLALGFQFQPAQAQFPPSVEGVKTLKSKFNENVTISFKEVSDNDTQRKHAEHY